MARRQQCVFPGGCREQAGVLCQAQVRPGGIICKVPLSLSGTEWVTGICLQGQHPGCPG